MLGAGGEQVYGASLERCRAHTDRAVNKQNMIRAEFLEKLVELHQALGEGVRIVMRVLRVIHRLNRQPARPQVDGLVAAPDVLQHLYDDAKAWRFLPLPLPSCSRIF